MYQTEELIKRLNFVSDNFPSYFLSFKNPKSYHKRNCTGDYLSYRKKPGPSADHSPLNTPRALTQKISSLPKTLTPRTGSRVKLFYSPLKQKPISLKDLSPNVTRVQYSRPNTNQMSKLSIPLREKPRSPNSKYLKIKIPKVTSRYFN